jgi:hypothetical protein
MLAHLERERHRLTAGQYAQEYLAIPQENARQVFADSLIAKILTATRPNTIQSGEDYICGVDPAGLGEDEGDIAILKNKSDGDMIQVDNIITRKLLTTETTTRILTLNKSYQFKKIFIDDGGVGFGVFSELLTSTDTRYITEALNNSARSLDMSDEKRKKIMKEDLVFNLLAMMERGNIKLLDDPEIRESLKSYRFEYEEKSKNIIKQYLPKYIEYFKNADKKLGNITSNKNKNKIMKLSNIRRNHNNQQNGPKNPNIDEPSALQEVINKATALLTQGVYFAT